MAYLDVDGARISFRTSGSGPVLLAPECNYSWDPGFEELMARSFTVVVASPRDFGTSDRVGAPYAPRAWADDMVARMRSRPWRPPAAGLARRGIAHDLHPGLDHEELNADLAVAWPAAERWLLARAH